MKFAKIREDKKLCYTKVIMLTAKKELNDKIEGYHTGVDDYLIKPFEEDELLAKINIFLNLQYKEEFNRLKESLL